MLYRLHQYSSEHTMIDIPLKILVVDTNQASSEMLQQALKSMREAVLSSNAVTSLDAAENILMNKDINTIYIDPLSLGFAAASSFILGVRQDFPNIVFVLYADTQALSFATNKSNFFGARRFAHYFKLDKRTPAATFFDEVKVSVRECQSDLSFTLTQEKIDQLQAEFATLSINQADETAMLPVATLRQMQKQLDTIANHVQQRQSQVKPKSVFLSYRFAETDYIEGLRELLEKEGFSVVTGLDANNYISKAIIERIKASEFFICLMTQADEKKDGTFTTSPWLLEEKGVALALDKRIVLMVEEGVGKNDVGGLQGDWQRIHFTPKGFTVAALKAINQLKSFES